jgi:hypothetical protein
LRSEVTVAESRVTQQQRDITALRAEIGPMEDAADVLHNTITTLERGRASIYLDLREIRKLANDRNVSLNSITHQGNSIAISGSAQNVGAIYDYARDLRGDKTDRFSKVWVSPVRPAPGGGSPAMFRIDGGLEAVNGVLPSAMRRSTRPFCS